MKPIITYAVWLPVNQRFGFFAGVESDSPASWHNVQSSILVGCETAPQNFQELKEWADYHGRTISMTKKQMLFTISAPSSEKQFWKTTYGLDSRQVVAYDVSVKKPAQ